MTYQDGIWDGEHCNDCNRGYDDVYEIEDWLWNLVVGNDSVVLCPSCLVQRAVRYGEEELPDPSVVVRPRARRTDPSTSHQAAELVMPKTGTVRAKVLSALMKFEGLTDVELVEQVDPEEMYAHSTIRSRRAELVDWGWVEPTEEIRNLHTVWRVTERGRAAF